MEVRIAPPHEIPIERAFLSAILLDRDRVGDFADLPPAAFYQVRHQLIWAAIQDMARAGQEIDQITLHYRLSQSHPGEVGAAYLIGLHDVGSTLGLETYAEIIANLHYRRQLLAAAQQLARLAHSEKTPVTEISVQARLAFATAAPPASRAALAEGAASAADRVLGLAQARHGQRLALTGWPCGIAALDQQTLGFEAGLLYLIAARPGMGKSALLAQAAWGLAAGRHPVLIFSLEMTTDSWVLRMLCQQARVPITDAKLGRLSDDQLSRLQQAGARLRELPLTICSLSGLTIEQMKTITRRVVGDDRAVVMIDHVGKIRTAGESVYERASRASNDLAAWAHEGQIALIAAAQLNRTSEMVQDKRPRLAQLRDSGAWEQDADVVFGLHRPGYYDKNDAAVASLVELEALKVRDGAVGRAWQFTWQPDWVGFAPLAQPGNGRPAAVTERIAA